jgi:hypothetical protein
MPSNRGIGSDWRKDWPWRYGAVDSQNEHHCAGSKFVSVQDFFWCPNGLWVPFGFNQTLLYNSCSCWWESQWSKSSTGQTDGKHRECEGPSKLLYCYILVLDINLLRLLHKNISLVFVLAVWGLSHADSSERDLHTRFCYFPMTDRREMRKI